MENTLTVVLAGGLGSRLSPLTAERAKPAVPFGGKYRIIDFCLTNCLHSGLRKVLVLTMYKSHSLQKHLRDGWSVFNPEVGEYITTVPPQMRKGDEWYKGTADAVYQNLYLLERSGADTVLILSADHIYRMDYAPLLKKHRESGAAVTVAAKPVLLEEAKGFGVMAVDESNRITAFHEKPREPQPMQENPELALASMGIYAFSLPLLLELLEKDHKSAESSHDFGKDILPSLIEIHKIQAYPFGGVEGRVTPDNYWRDVGTLDAYYESNMDLLQPVPNLDLYQEDWPIRTYQQQTPPARTVPGKYGTEGISINSIVAGGAIISGGNVQNSILFPRVYVGEEAIVEQSILLNGVSVGDKAKLKNCIIDKGVMIPAGESIGIDPKRDAERFKVTDKGIVIVPGNYRFD